MKILIETLMVIAVWLLGVAVVILGFLQWLSWLVMHYTSGQWAMVAVDLIFCEILIPIMGVIRLFWLIF